MNKLTYYGDDIHIHLFIIINKIIDPPDRDRQLSVLCINLVLLVRYTSCNNCQ